VCDADLAPVIAKEAKQLGSPDKPRLIYWLTVNTHIPVAPNDALTNFNCVGVDNQFAQPTVCRMAELWHDFFEAVSKLALDPSIAPAEILIVGDHAPPLWSKRGRAEFAAGKVAWYRLTPR
jgi:phosphoglycerol transferase MdoB-like AlkP superfamily enzyme